MPTLNAMDNNGEAFATVLIVEDDRRTGPRLHTEIAPTLQSFMGTGGGNVPMIFSHTQGLDAQPSETNSPTLRTGGSGMAVVYEPKSAFEENWAESEVKNALRANASKSSHAVTTESVVRRLTPVECERLQGFPDGWTDGQADSNRYKQMGNAVAVPVVEWIISRMVAVDE